MVVLTPVSRGEGRTGPARSAANRRSCSGASSEAAAPLDRGGLGAWLGRPRGHRSTNNRPSPPSRLNHAGGGHGARRPCRLLELPPWRREDSAQTRGSPCAAVRRCSEQAWIATVQWPPPPAGRQPSHRLPPAGRIAPARSVMPAGNVQSADMGEAAMSRRVAIASIHRVRQDVKASSMNAANRSPIDAAATRTPLVGHGAAQTRRASAGVELARAEQIGHERARDAGGNTCSCRNTPHQHARCGVDPHGGVAQPTHRRDVRKSLGDRSVPRGGIRHRWLILAPRRHPAGSRLGLRRRLYLRMIRHRVVVPERDLQPGAGRHPSS